MSNTAYIPLSAFLGAANFMSRSPPDFTHKSEGNDISSTIRRPSMSSDDPSDDGSEGHVGSYSTRMAELFSDGEERALLDGEDDENADEEDFLYTGVDASDVSAGYQDQLRDVLGSELTDEETDVPEVGQPSLHEDLEKQDFGPHDISPDTHSQSPVMRPSESPEPARTLQIARPFLHPAVSRLRSFTPQLSRRSSNGSVTSETTSHTHATDVFPTSSHFSLTSRVSSRSNLHSGSDLSALIAVSASDTEREVFKWTALRNISEHVYSPLTQKLSSVLGTSLLGSPTVLAANGLICIGTDQGKVCVYDFKQTLKCICGNEVSAKVIGAVTAVALSHDHTYVASGHTSGYIQLYDLKKPRTPARVVPPTTLAAVASGRKEGHIQGSRIVSINFIAGRHTALVSSDDRGLAFSHSLGKMLFVEAPDILRILGQYQTETSSQLQLQRTRLNTAAFASDTTLPQRRKSRYTILETVPLPLGTSPHPTDQYGVIALLTPTKLVVVGLKPTPRTWFKHPRDANITTFSKQSKIRGTLAWYPSVSPYQSKSQFERPLVTKSQEDSSTTPMLVCTWGNVCHLIRVDESRSNESVRNSRTGKQVNVDVGRIVYKNIGRWSIQNDILAVQWLNVNQIVMVTAENVQVYDIHVSKIIETAKFDGLALVSPSLGHTMNGAMSYSDSVGNIAHSVRTYKGKIFLLGTKDIRVGTLLTWADRILSFVEEGNFLGAIELARTYYVGDAPGNRNGLPDDLTLRKEVIGVKIRDLMMASSRYAFSEERMSDGTHVTPDGRGVDRTSLFEDLVSVSCRASIALDDFNFFFEELFQRYDDSGISKIFLRQLEPFILNNDVRYAPPRITQRLVTLQEDDGRPNSIEGLIWHIDPSCLDVNQAVHLCQKYHLYDALVYVYTRALHDSVAPVVEFLGLIRRVQQYRQRRGESIKRSYSDVAADVESIVLNAYKIYPYISNVLSGLTYPSGEPLVKDEASQAKEEVYSFLFLGHSGVWPQGDGARLVLTADEEGGIEPTYPYVRQLLRFDSESFLHSLDIAFEDSFLNEGSPGTSRLIIVRILLEVLTSADLPSDDKTFIRIFVARNVPKYPQFLQLPPTILHNVLIGLAEDMNPDTREDRQLAAECLLSTYNPHESERIMHLFEEGGFYRILRSWHRYERRWGALIRAYVDDNDLSPSEMFHSVDEVLATSKRANKGSISAEILETLSTSLRRLLDAHLPSTAVLLDKHAPSLHESVLQHLPDDAQRFFYLKCLLGLSGQDEGEGLLFIQQTGPSKDLPASLRQSYIALHCRYDPTNIIGALKHHSPDSMNWNDVFTVFEASEVYDALVWATNWIGEPREALQKAERYHRKLTQRMTEALSQPVLPTQQQDSVLHDVKSLLSIGAVGIDICIERSQSFSQHIPLEDIWFQLLNSQVNTIQSLSASQQKAKVISPSFNLHDHVLAPLRALVQRTFTSLVSITSTEAVSFPRLFKRLVNSPPPTMHTHYTEFRTILTGMLESYRSEGDMLAITKHLIDRDLFDTVADIARERQRGWSPQWPTLCFRCKKPLLLDVNLSPRLADIASSSQIRVTRLGSVYHNDCSPIS